MEIRTLSVPEPPSSLPTKHPRIRTFHVRKGRMSHTGSSALERLGAQWLVEVSCRRVEPEALFGRRAPLVLEIGSGMGHSTVVQAGADPSTDILAVDVHTPGIAALLLKCEEAGVENVRAAIGDAVEVVEHMLTSKQLAGARVFFPDPWPKIRHRKRRLIQPEFVDLLVSRLRPGGFIHCATDDLGYAEQMVEVFAGHRDLENPSGGFTPRRSGRPLTKFEQRAARDGRRIADVYVTRRLIT